MTRQNRQSELLYNEELHKIYEITKNISPSTAPGSDGPVASQLSSLWLNGEDLKYYTPSGWSDMFSQKFKMICEILAPTRPINPVKGQLWLNNGIMMYFNGMDWYTAKAVSVDNTMDYLSFDKFLLMPSITGVASNGAVQYLIPNYNFDRVFIDGLNRISHEKLSDVSFSLPEVDITGKDVTVVHMNPGTLEGIDRKLVTVDQATLLIDSNGDDTEFYGFTNGKGKLLIEGIDYVDDINGTKLNTPYNVVMLVRYRFGASKHDGYLISPTEITIDGISGVRLDSPITDPICLFVDGMYLEQGPVGSENYTYTPETGFIQISLGDKMDLSVISFSKKDEGTISVENVEADGTQTGTVTLTQTFINPLVFVSGEAMGMSSGLADLYIDGTIPSTELHVINAKVGMSFSVVESDGMYVREGIVDSMKTIPCALEDIPTGGRPLLFVDGLFISDVDTNWDANAGYIQVQGLTAGQSYVLLKDQAAPNKRLLFDDSASYYTIPVTSNPADNLANIIDDALVYIDNELICNTSTVETHDLPAYSINGHTLQLIDPALSTSEWYKYNSQTATWDVITDSLILSELNAAGSSYTTRRTSVNILKDFNGKVCKYYGYCFADSIENPLLLGEIKGKGVAPYQYQLPLNHSYIPGANELSLWVNGVRQYDSSTETEISRSSFAIPEQCDPVITPGNPVTSIFYVIEKREGAEKVSCTRDILTSNDRIDGIPNTYRSHIFLYPGNVRVFLNGYRQPAAAYKIIDSKTIMFNSLDAPLFDKGETFPDQTPYEIMDNILIEVRDDYSLKEITMEITNPGQNSWSGLESEIIQEIIDSKDQVMIYINGAAYGSNFTIDQVAQKITLNNEEVASQLSKGNTKDFITFEWR
jgi:hypothetical protein